MMMRPIPNRINTHFVRLAYNDPLASPTTVPPIVEDTMRALLDIHTPS